MAVGLARSSVDHRYPLLAFAIDVSARVEGVLQKPDHIAVADRRPVEGCQPLAVGGPWKEQTVGHQRQMRLACAAELAEPFEHPSDRLLQANVRIEAEPDLAMPDIADRHADPQLAPAGLRPGGVEHARADHAELELADAALHAKQQTIVRAAGIIDAVEVDDPRLDQAAQLEQVMPVPAVAGQARCVEAQHSANLARAERSDELLEAGPGDHAARRAAEIVVDHLDRLEATSSGNVDQLVLAPPTLGVSLDLGLRRLPHIDHRLALQDRRREDLTARHRPAPRALRPRPLPPARSRGTSRPDADRAGSFRAAASSPVRSAVVGVAKASSVDLASGCSCLVAMSPEQLRRNPRRFRRSSRSCSAARDTRGAPISIATQADASSIHAATTVTTPGSTSTWTKRPALRLSARSIRTRRPNSACQR